MDDPKAWAELLEGLRKRRPEARIRGFRLRKRLELPSDAPGPASLELGSWDPYQEDEPFPLCRVRTASGLRGKLRLGGALGAPLDAFRNWSPIPGLDPAFADRFRPVSTRPEEARELLTPETTALIASWAPETGPVPGVLLDRSSVAVCSYESPVTGKTLDSLLQRTLHLAGLVSGRRQRT